MAKTKEERIVELKAQRDQMMADYKAKLAAKKAEYDRRIKAASKGGPNERKHQAHIKIVGFSAIMKEVQNDETGKTMKSYHNLFTRLANEPDTAERLRNDYKELAALFMPK